MLLDEASGRSPSGSLFFIIENTHAMRRARTVVAAMLSIFYYCGLRHVHAPRAHPLQTARLTITGMPSGIDLHSATQARSLAGGEWAAPDTRH